MDPYMAMMSPERLEEEEMKALASQLRGVTLLAVG